LQAAKVANRLTSLARQGFHKLETLAQFQSIAKSRYLALGSAQSLNWRLEHDPEKWKPVFGKDHAQTRRQSRMTIRRKVILL
jgi:hypothetical protein